jgi:hypothetical protein
MPRWFPMSPMSRRDAETGGPMNVEVARCAVKNRPAKLALEVSLHVQEFEPQHLRLKHDEAECSRLTHEEPPRPAVTMRLR